MLALLRPTIQAHEPQPLPISNTASQASRGVQPNPPKRGGLHHAEQAGSSQAFHYILRNPLRCLNLCRAALQPAGQSLGLLGHVADFRSVPL